jgi:hypothetical protein
MAKEKDHLSEAGAEFANLLKKAPTAPVQKVTPAVQADEEEKRLYIFIPDELMTRIKLRSVKEKKTMKELVTEILNQHI